MIADHPEVAFRDCQTCLKYGFDEDGNIERDRAGRPELRIIANPPPCRTQAGCPKGTPENQRTLKAEPQQWLDAYMECKAVGDFPDDPFVRQVARVIADVEAESKERKEDRFRAMLMRLAIRGPI